MPFAKNAMRRTSLEGAPAQPLWKLWGKPVTMRGTIYRQFMTHGGVHQSTLTQMIARWELGVVIAAKECSFFQSDPIVLWCSLFLGEGAFIQFSSGDSCKGMFTLPKWSSHILWYSLSLSRWISIQFNYLLNRITYLRLVYNRTLKQLSKGAAVFSVAERVFKQQSNTVSCCAM